MTYQEIKIGVVVSAIAFSFTLVVAAVQFTQVNAINPLTNKFLVLFLGTGILVALHTWSASVNASGIQKLLLNLLYVEFFFSVVLLTTLIFDFYNFLNSLILLFAVQVVHGALYLANMFLFDASPSMKVNLSEYEIMDKSKKPMSYFTTKE
jgi:hypothetical protein